MKEKSTYTESDLVKKELEELSPFLLKAKQKIKEDEDIPFRYFETLPEKVIDRITDEKANPASLRDQIMHLFATRKRYVWAFATLFVAALVGTLFLLKPSQSVESQLANIDVHDIKLYLAAHASELDEDQLLQLTRDLHPSNVLQLSDEDMKTVLDEYLYQTQNDAN